MDGFKLLEHIGLELDLPVISEHFSPLLDLSIFKLMLHTADGCSCMQVFAAAAAPYCMPTSTRMCQHACKLHASGLRLDYRFAEPPGLADLTPPATRLQ